MRRAALGLSLLLWALPAAQQSARPLELHLAAEGRELWERAMREHLTSKFRSAKRMPPLEMTFNSGLTLTYEWSEGTHGRILSVVAHDTNGNTATCNYGPCLTQAFDQIEYMFSGHADERRRRGMPYGIPSSR